MGLEDVLHSLRDTQQRHGVRAAAVLAWSKLRPDARQVYLFGLTHPRAMPATATAVLSHTLRLATLEEIAGGVASGLWSPENLEAARRGDRCLLQRDSDRLIGYTWTAVTSPVLLTEGFYLSLPGDVAYIYKAYTLPEYRGFGFQAARTLELARLLRAEGKRRLLCYVDRLSFDSLSGVRKTGYERIGDVHFVRRNGQVRSSLRITSQAWNDLHRV